MPARHPRTVILLGFLAAAFSPAVAAPGDVKTSFGAPCKYPAGLATDGQNLFVVDWREAKIHEVAPADGRLVRTFDAPTLMPAGLAFGDGRLFVSDDHAGRVFAVKPGDRLVLSSFEAPGQTITGLAWSDGVLFLLERRAGKIYKVQPDDGTILAYFAAPNPTCTGLACDGRHLWVSDRVKNELYMVDPATGTVLNIIAAPGPYAAGLAWLDGHLWNVDFQTRKLYQLVIRDPQQSYRLFDPREARIEYLWGVYNYGPGAVRDLVVNVAIPEALANQELVSEPEYAPTPEAVVTDQWGQCSAVFDFVAVPAGQRQTITYNVKARVSAIRYTIFPDACGTLADIPDEIRTAYTVDDARYGVQSAYIQEAAKRIVGDEENPYWIARKIFNHVIERLEYEMIGGWDVPEVVLKRGSGSCSEYTFSFIALCRAAGLPARYQGAIVVRGDEASVDEAFHRWAQVYLPNYGWIPVDANRGDAKSPADQARGFGELPNHYLITTQSGGGSQHLGWSYNSFATYTTEGYAKIEEGNFGFWEPLNTDGDAPATGGGRPADECRRP